MVTLTSLWMPILISTVLAFVAGWLMHALIRHHRRDFKAAPSEAAAIQALGSLGLTRGDYFIPHQAQSQQGTAPITVIMTVMRAGGMQLGSALAQWFIGSSGLSVGGI
jgi:hypothetical protein